MSMLGKLFTIEWIKARKRSIFWVAVITQIMLIAVPIGVQQYLHHLGPQENEGFRLPEDWVTLLQVATQIGMVMIVIAISLLTASESMWRTQRQNVIDGLSRAQYFSGKLMIVMMLALILWLITPIMGVIMAATGGSGALTSPVFNDEVMRRLPNLLLYFIAMGVMAFMFGMIATSSGAALGLVLAFVLIEPMMGAIMTARGGVLPIIAQYLPLDIFGNLVSKASYDPAAMARMTAMMQKANLPAPLSLQTSVILSVVYIIAFIAITWMVFRTRDL